MAYELNRPDAGKGLVVLLRRPNSPEEAMRIRLRDLDERASYRVTDLDTGETKRFSGAALSQDGLDTAVKTKPGSALLLYQRE